MLKSRKMKDIKLKEVSLVDRPANLRPFLMFKQEGKPGSGFLPVEKKKIKIEIASDGTKSGTSITINKEKVDKLRSFNFSVWESDDEKAAVNCSYSKLIEEEGGFQRTETYYLAKGESPMDPRIAKLLKTFFGDKEVKVEKSELNEATIVEIEKALTTVNSFSEEMPDELIAAIGMLGIQAGQGYNMAKAEDDIEKKGAKLSKDTVKQLNAIISAAQALLPKDESGDKTEKVDTTDVEKMVKTLTDTVAELTGKLEKKESTEQLEGISKTLGEITERLKKVESKPAATKKSIDGNEELDDEGTPVKKDTGLKWPSLSAPAD